MYAAPSTSKLNQAALALAASRKKKHERRFLLFVEKKKADALIKTTTASSSPTGVSDFVSDFSTLIYDGENKYI
jgi:hypothetical protein